MTTGFVYFLFISHNLTYYSCNSQLHRVSVTMYGNAYMEGLGAGGEGDDRG